LTSYIWYLLLIMTFQPINVKKARFTFILMVVAPRWELYTFFSLIKVRYSISYSQTSHFSHTLPLRLKCFVVTWAICIEILRCSTFCEKKNKNWLTQGYMSDTVLMFMTFDICSLQQLGKEYNCQNRHCKE
jgi:hypothetical protein